MVSLGSGQGGSALENTLGYDPWNYPNVEATQRFFVCMMAGWSVYEAIECSRILIGARAKWRTAIFLATAAGLFFGFIAVCLVFFMVLGTTQATGNDLFRGPLEYGINSAINVSVTAARLSYFYGSMVITLAVFPSNRRVRNTVCLVTILGACGALGYAICLGHFFRLTFELYPLYTETKSVSAMFNRMFTAIIPVLPSVHGTEYFASATNVVFILSTKPAFLWAIFSALSVGLLEATVKVLTSRPTQRIITGSIWSIAEVVLLSVIGITDITFTLTLYALVFQVNTLAMLAFQESSAIIKAYSMAHSAHSAKATPAPSTQRKVNVSVTMDSQAHMLDTLQ